MASVDAVFTRGFRNLPCIRCGEMDRITINLGDTCCFHCEECEADFDAAQVEELVSRWTGVVAWVRTAPLVEENHQ